MTVGSLFAGIGGFDLGFERAGFEIRWQVEIDPFCRAVLAEHWPEVRRYEDVREVHGSYVADAPEFRCDRTSAVTGSLGESEDERRVRESSGGSGRDDYRRYLESVDVICGGFPCQPHSLAGRRLGAADERDLWPEFARLIRELRPRWVVAENVPGLLSADAGRFFGNVLRDLAESGYDAEWDCLPASAFGAPHRRDRVWLVAYPHRRRELQPQGSERDERRWAGNGREDVADTSGGIRQRQTSRSAGHIAFGGEDVADADESRLSHERQAREPQKPPQIFGRMAFPEFKRCGDAWWAVEPDVGRVAHGVSARVDRLRGLGNAIVPQIAEWIAHRIQEAETVMA